MVVAGRTLAAFAYLLNGLLALSVLGVLWLRLWMEWGWWTMLPPAIYMALHLTTWHRLKQRTGAALNPILGATARNMLIFTLLLTLLLI